MQCLIENPVPPTDRQLADYLSGVFQRAEKHVAAMSAARANSSPSLVFASEEAGKAAVRERRERFCGYRDALRDANIQLSSYSERLVAVAPSIVSLVGALENGHFNPEIGKAECDSIEKIGAALLHEESPDDVWKRRIRATMREFELMSSARQRLRHLEREEREAHDLSFQKSGLPPLTPWQKFLQLKPTGQRDGFG
jgi:hypothetical protein